ncbi:hypothetical protein JW805_07675 [Roseomonas aeriglobus]|nr:hypothetical protein [Roseomonas aeriglobus]
MEQTSGRLRATSRRGIGRLPLAAAGISALLFATAASGQTMTVRVDAQSRPWSPGANPKLAFGVGDGRAPTMIVRFLPVGSKIRFEATGRVGWIDGGRAFDPDGDPDLVLDRSVTLLPSYYISKRAGPVRLVQLVGAFVDADGTVIGKPFAIGRKAEVEVPEGAAAISLGTNDDKFSDNFGSYDVTVYIQQAKVTVEEPETAK